MALGELGLHSGELQDLLLLGDFHRLLSAFLALSLVLEQCLRGTRFTVRAPKIKR